MSLGFKRLKKGDSHLKHNTLISTIPWLLFLTSTQRRFSLTKHNSSIYPTPPMKVEESVPKRRHIKFRRQRITQKKSMQYIKRYFPAFASRPADILLGHRNYFQRKDCAEPREYILCYEHKILPVHIQSFFSSHRIPSLRATQYIIILIMYLLLLPSAVNICTKKQASIKT